MPTGYTAPIEEDPNFTFEQFVRRCALAFLVESREEGINCKIQRTCEIDPYRQNQVWKAKAELSELEGMTTEQIEKHCLEDYLKRRGAWEETNALFKEKKAKYDTMREKVEAWDGSAFQGLKKFMLEQIETSTQFIVMPAPEPTRQNPGDWYEQQLKWVRQDILRAEERLIEAQQSIQQRNEWVGLLLDTFPLPEDKS